MKLTAYRSLATALALVSLAIAATAALTQPARASDPPRCEDSPNPDCPRGENTLATPELIVPRSESYILGDAPLLRWQTIEHTNQYYIDVVAPDGSTVWQTVVEDANEVRYAGPSLDAGTSYIVYVGALDRQAEARFTVLPAEAAAEIRQEAAALAANDNWQDLVALYRDRQLFSAALTVLEAQLSEGDASPEIYNQLAALYAEIGWPELSEAYARRGAEVLAE